jgi:hypothetical protein
MYQIQINSREAQDLHYYVLIYKDLQDIRSNNLGDARYYLKRINNALHNIRNYGIKQDIRLLSKEHTVEFVVEGFLRQGNNNLRKIILDSFPDVAVPLHLTHNPLTVKQALEAKKNIICSIRNPFDAVASLLKRDLDDMDYRDLLNGSEKQIHNSQILFERYCYFYEQIIDNDKILLVDFDILVSNPELVLKVIGSKYSLPIKENIEKNNNNTLKNLPQHPSTKDLKISNLLFKLDIPNKTSAINKYKIAKETSHNQFLSYTQ